MDAFGKLFRFRDARFRRLAPDHVRQRRVTEAARDRLIDPGAHAMKTFRRSIAGEKCAIAFIDVARQE